MKTATFSRFFAVTTVTLCALAAHAQSTLTGAAAATQGQQADARAIVERGAVAIQFQGAQAPSPFTSTKVDYSGMAAASAGPVYAAAPSPATCVDGGSGVAAQVVKGGFGVNMAGDPDVPCNGREGAKTVKYLGIPGWEEIAKEMLCDAPQYRQAMLRAKRPCSIDADKTTTNGVAAAAGEPTDPYVRRRQGLAPL